MDPVLGSLNLPASVRDLYQRRYSDPEGGLNKTSLPVGDVHRCTRRHSLGAGAADFIKDVSSLNVRSCLDRMSRDNGYTAWKHALASQARRCSSNIDPKELGSTVQRDTFLEKKDEEKLKSNHGLMGTKNAYDDSQCQQSPRKQMRRHSAVDKKKAGCAMEHTSEQWYVKLREIRRNLRQGDGSCDLYAVPKCRYKLREDGALASELAGQGRVRTGGCSPIPPFQRCLSQGAVSVEPSEPDNLLPRAMSVEESESSKIQLLNSFSKKRPQSSLSVCSHISDATGAVGREMADAKPRKPFKSFEIDEFKYSFYNPQETCAKQFRINRLFKRKKSFSELLEEERSNKDGRGRKHSELNLEFLGGPLLHGCPKYSGRLRLLPSRSVHFLDG